jgi:hypothetical protein
MTRAFHVFPCQHAFHSDCLIDEVIIYSDLATPIPCQKHSSEIFAVENVGFVQFQGS